MVFLGKYRKINKKKMNYSESFIDFYHNFFLLSLIKFIITGFKQGLSFHSKLFLWLLYL